ncbi:Bug family tripartite tricarboxylate transporter substrate binding protein [Pseudarthrobacter raffinosi]|uniref:Bug family tripartite tricarboxylate transporter substrate binding protein n=1 Tax=Pseudarthrobacter raffinosi TaxID=2953651 RepID=UPI00208F7E92|nr:MULTISPECIES: tripartite tricarboxylate transporter substrate binding protein [unclassified Pseudarthrobacter]MCO4251199.1 tripartite tricarboxylate transporter substrate binding protein [Pseudarthrobacter sp. MDT3-9]MCO4265087.1 tripartite tricarboxylate transporter substrate binding protein [Pseudarthrobacter sp. MDT3-26]
MKRKTIAPALVMALALAGCSGSNLGGSQADSAASGSSGCEGDDFPSKTIEIVVPYAAGGGTDTVARALADAAKEYLPNKPSVIVTNKPGASSTLGIAAVANAKPDGYTLAAVTSTGLAIQPHLPETPYEVDDLQPVVQAVSSPQVLLVKNDAPWQTIDEWLKYMKENPGFKYASANTLGTASVAMTALSSAAGIETKNVPFEGAAPSVTALLGGHVQGAAVQSFEAMAQMKAGTVRALVNVGSSPIKGYEDVPLASEVWPDVEYDVFTGLAAPAGVCEENLKILDKAFSQALENPKVIEQFANIGVEPAYAGPEDFREIIKTSHDKIGAIVEDTKTP